MADRILVVDDEHDQCLAFESALCALGYEVDTTTDPCTALDMARERTYHAILADLEMPKISGIELCDALSAARPETPVLVITGHATVDSVAQAFRAGAYDYLCKPVDVRQLTVRVTRATSHGDLRAELSRAHKLEFEGTEPPSLRGRSTQMRTLRGLVQRVAPSESSVLLQGETGTGKELVARSIHGQSTRAAGAFVAINCAALPEPLLESELFGHVRGAFTDAKQDRPGLFVEAHGGTLFLDEVAELSLNMQTKLLRALQERQIRPVGGQHEVDVDVRLIAASHRDLDRAMQEGTFRQDLYYRINVVRIELPPLRERRADILELAVHFLHRAASRHGRPAPRLSLQAAEILMAHEFPGNVRELENCMERAAAVGRYDHVLVQDLPESLRAAPQEARAVDSLLTMEEVQRRYVHRVMRLVEGNKSRAAHLLHVDRRTLHRKMWPGGGASPRPEPGSPADVRDTARAEELSPKG
jgi:DNA-binding NtrC family response regulator